MKGIRHRNQVSQGPSTQPFVGVGFPGVTTYLIWRLSFDSVRGLRRLLLRFRGLDLARLENVVGEVATMTLISQLKRKAGRVLLLGRLDVLSKVLYTDAAGMLKLTLPFVPVVKVALELIDFGR